MNLCVAAQVGELADGDEVMDADAAHHRDVVGNGDMPGEHDVVGDDAAAANMGIVADVCIDHQQVSVANAGESASGFRADMDGDRFANDVFIADLQASGPATIFQILRRSSDNGEGMDDIVSPDGSVAFNDDVAQQPAAGADDDMRTHNAERPDLDVIAEMSL